MENTLFPNDVILVNKVIYGPKLPRNPFEVSWVNLLFYLNDNARKAIEEKWWPYYRLKGIQNIHQGDVLVYQLSRTFFVVKRCVAVAGDTLSIIDGDIYTNDIKSKTPSTVKERYHFKIRNRQDFNKQRDTVIPDVYIYSGNKSNSFTGEFTYEERNKIKGISGVYGLEKEIDSFDSEKKLFANPSFTQWTLDNMGPFVIPQKGLKIPLNEFNLQLYKKILKEFEKVEIKKCNEDYFINEEKVSTYSFKQDYFFVMGDYRKGSMDSRYIGFIPEEHIIGKVQYVLFSNYHDKFQWGRFLREVL